MTELHVYHHSGDSQRGQGDSQTVKCHKLRCFYKNNNAYRQTDQARYQRWDKFSDINADQDMGNEMPREGEHHPEPYGIQSLVREIICQQSDPEERNELLIYRDCKALVGKSYVSIGELRVTLEQLGIASEKPSEPDDLLHIVEDKNDWQKQQIIFHKFFLLLKVTLLYLLHLYDIILSGECQYKNQKIHYLAKVCHFGGIAMTETKNPSAIRSQKEITDALLALMRKHPYAEITVKQIILESRLARKTFYRNFESKDDVLLSLIRRIFREYFDIVNEARSDVLTTIFDFADRHREELLLLDKNSMLHVPLQVINETAPVLHNTLFKEQNPFVKLFDGLDDGYLMALNIGAVWNVIALWIHRGMTDKPEDVRQTIETYLNRFRESK